MGQDDVDTTREHYDRHANRHLTHEEALREREAGGAIMLKRYHNAVKRELINRFACKGGRLLDLACGRGGDLRKWFDAGLSYVRGYDLSPGEIEEAKKRLEDIRRDRRNRFVDTRVDFMVTDQVGAGDLGLSGGQPYDAVSCMFAIHYFFRSDNTLRNFFRNASSALKDRGFLFGTCPDGKRVMGELHRDGGSKVERPMLKLKKLWEGEQPPALGGRYVCHIADTVVEGHEGFTEGSVEYLVFFNVMKAVAEKYDLFPVTKMWGSKLDKLLKTDESEGKQWCRHFVPHHRAPDGQWRQGFPGADTSLEDASKLFVAFAFQKREPVNKKHFALSEEHAAALKASGGVSEAHRDKRQRVER